MNTFSPEGALLGTAENMAAIKTIYSLQDAMQQGKILEARAAVCDNAHNLIVELPCAKGIIPREEGAIGIADGTTKDIALITKVNKPVCFKVTKIERNEDGQYTAFLSRRAVQQECMDSFISQLMPGDIIPAKVTHLEQFGAFVDIGCGIPSLVPIDAISISRISHPSDRFAPNQDIRVIIKGTSNGRIWLSHKELLGTWEENAALFSYGETVSGVVRSVEDYGIFIELTPNLAGLAEPKEGVYPGQHCSVYIKALIPEKMKVKLIIVDVFSGSYSLPKLKYFVPESCNHMASWRYSTPESGRLIESVFK